MNATLMQPLIHKNGLKIKSNGPIDLCEKYDLLKDLELII